MRLGRIIVCLLAVILSMSAVMPMRAQSAAENDCITAAEQREARELVEQFNKKFVETNDIAPLIKDYFVPDFATRLGQHADTLPFTLIDWKDTSAPPAASDLQQFYVASTNVLHMLFPLGADAMRKHRERGDQQEPKLAEILPPAALELVLSDPLLRAWAVDEEEESKQNVPATNELGDAGNDDKQDADDAHRIENTAQLCHYTELCEQLAKILHEHLAAHPISFEREAVSDGVESESDDGASFDPNKIEMFEHARMLSDEFYGYPKGTRLICANVGMLHVEIVRVDDKLRILSVYLIIE